jgi:hypothetical protein
MLTGVDGRGYVVNAVRILELSDRLVLQIKGGQGSLYARRLLQRAVRMAWANGSAKAF